jgi:hypothetical protein
VTLLDFADSILVARAPDDVYAMASDVTRMGEWSPVCRACWWDDGAGPRVGAWFTGRNETADRTWETRSQVVAAGASGATGEGGVPGREFAWEVNDGRVRWGFRVDAEAGGTRLTQFWAFLPVGIAWFRERYGAAADAEIAQRSAAALSGIPQTLAAIKAAAEAG